jgi:peptide/nickel transport system permease protein
LQFRSHEHPNAILTLNWKLLKDAAASDPAALALKRSHGPDRAPTLSMLEVLGQDYIRTARAKGLNRRAVILKHAFRNSLLPLVTVIGLSLGSLLGGAVLTETIFGLSGLGRTLYDSITARDYIVVQSFTVVIAVFFVILNLIVDMSYAYLDPRIRLD